MFVCKLCKSKEYETLRGVGNHLRYCKSNTNNMNSESYYNTFIKTDKNDGICLNCGNPTRFVGIELGYSTYCSNLACSRYGLQKGFKTKARVVNKYIDGKIYTCKICNKEFNNPVGLRNHLVFCSKNVDKLNAEQYYIRYIKTAGEGLCKKCGKSTKFKGIDNGYDSYCDKKCARQSTVIEIKKHNVKLYEDRLKKVDLKMLNNHDVIEGSDIIKLECINCGYKFEGYVFNVTRRKGKCPNCRPFFRGDGERRFLDFLRSSIKKILNIEKIYILTNSFKHNDREIDFYIPDYNVTIDYNEFWHTKNKFSNDDIMRVRNIVNSGYKHLVIWENEWDITNHNEFNILCTRLLNDNNYLKNVDYYTGYYNLNTDNPIVPYRNTDSWGIVEFNRPDFIQ